jgi:hypothetical protein
MVGISCVPILFLCLDLLILNVFLKMLLNLQLELCIGYPPSSARLESLLGSQDTSPLSPISYHCGSARNRTRNMRRAVRSSGRMVMEYTLLRVLRYCVNSVYQYRPINASLAKLCDEHIINPTIRTRNDSALSYTCALPADQRITGSSWNSGAVFSNSSVTVTYRPRGTASGTSLSHPLPNRALASGLRKFPASATRRAYIRAASNKYQSIP